jgi:hypothetical protein
MKVISDTRDRHCHYYNCDDTPLSELLSPRGYHPIISQSFATDMVLLDIHMYLCLKLSVLKNVISS